MEYREDPAPRPLAEWIHRLWYVRGGDPAGSTQPVVPDGHAELILHLGEPFGQVDAIGRVRPQATALVSGQLTGPYRLLPSADAEVVGVSLTPAGAGALLGVRMSELTDAVVPLQDVRPRLARRIFDAVARCTTVAERFAAAARTVDGLGPARPHPTVLAAQDALETTLRTRALANRCGTTVRTLQRRFARDVGVSPGLLARITRFRRAYRMLTAGPPQSAARVAALAGYYDQAHLIREFRRFAGESPARYFRRPHDLASAFLVEARPRA